MLHIIYAIVLTIFATKADGARILAVAPTPSLSHQVVFYPLIKELAKRGHEVTFITTNPAFPNENPPKNLKEIDLKDLSYSIWKKEFTVSEFGKDNFIYKGTKAIVEVIPKVFEEQLRSNDVQNLIKNEKSFDLLLLQAWFRPAMIWSHIYKVPVIKISSLGMAFDNPENFGAAVHPLLYPSAMHQRIYNLTFWETITELYKRYYVEKLYQNYEVEENKIVAKIFGPEFPPLSELQKNAHMLFLNVNSFWDRNRPVPRNIVYFGHVHQKPAEELPQDILSFLDSSQGAIYMSFGTNVPPSHLPPATIKMFLKVFSELPYRVLWKFDVDKLEGKPDNVMIKKWFPQSDIFRHPNLKLIITQGGLQTTEEAIEVGVPLLGLPMLADQWLNVENYVQLGIGLQLDMENLNEEKFKSNLLQLIEDPSFRRNMHQLRTYIHDTPLTALNRAISWTEYVLKHLGATHLKSPASNMSWWDYYEVELFIIVLNSIMFIIIGIWYTFKLLLKKFEAIIANQTRMNA